MVRHPLTGFLLCLFCTISSCQSESTTNFTALSTAEQALEQGDYALAETLLIRLLEELKTDENRASALYYLGEVYRLQGQFEKAEPLFWQALPMWAKSVGPTHPDMAKGLTSLGYMYEARLEFRKAEPLVKQALKVREMAFGMDHPNIVPSLEQYAALLKRMNRPDEALALTARGQTILAKQTHS